MSNVMKCQISCQISRNADADAGYMTPQAETPRVTYFGANHCPTDGNF